MLYARRQVYTASGTYTPPEGVTELRLILVGRGQDGQRGEDGTWYRTGEAGADGAGGRVWSGTVHVNPGQSYDILIDDHAQFGVYSSADGRVYDNGYTDIQSGESYARSGVASPMDGTGDGGAGGAGGVQVSRHTETQRDYTVGGTLPGNTSGVYIPVDVTVVDNRPGKGQDGAPGAGGCVVIYWDKEAET